MGLRLSLHLPVRLDGRLVLFYVVLQLSDEEAFLKSVLNPVESCMRKGLRGLGSEPLDVRHDLVLRCGHSLLFEHGFDIHALIPAVLFVLLILFLLFLFLLFPLFPLFI